MIANHIAPRLSELDLMVARSVPPGGNWKDIPATVPSQRLQQIRESYARGEGSRSTYYGRLLANEPAYTISTYFSRPGNGCHLHFDVTQNRTLAGSKRHTANAEDCAHYIAVAPSAVREGGLVTKITTHEFEWHVFVWAEYPGCSWPTKAIGLAPPDLHGSPR